MSEQNVCIMTPVDSTVKAGKMIQGDIGGQRQEECLQDSVHTWCGAWFELQVVELMTLRFLLDHRSEWTMMINHGKTTSLFETIDKKQQGGSSGKTNSVCIEP